MKSFTTLLNDITDTRNANSKEFLKFFNFSSKHIHRISVYVQNYVPFLLIASRKKKKSQKEKGTKRISTTVPVQVKILHYI